MPTTYFQAPNPVTDCRLSQFFFSLMDENFQCLRIKKASKPQSLSKGSVVTSPIFTTVAISSFYMVIRIWELSPRRWGFILPGLNGLQELSAFSFLLWLWFFSFTFKICIFFHLLLELSKVLLFIIFSQTFLCACLSLSLYESVCIQGKGLRQQICFSLLHYNEGNHLRHLLKFEMTLEDKWSVDPQRI